MFLMENRGLGYKGSKNRIADRIVELLPERGTLYDLFCGGGAVTHSAVLSGKYRKIVMNDIDWRCTDLFVRAVSGDLGDTDRWVSREEFNELKDTDSFVAFCWSFSNNLRDYMYSAKAEPVKRAMHHAVFFDDHSLMAEYGYDTSFLSEIDGRERKYSALKRYLKQNEPDLNTRHQALEGISRIDTLKKSFMDMSAGRIQHLERAERFSSLKELTPRIELQHLESGNPITRLKGFDCHAQARLEHVERIGRLRLDGIGDGCSIETHSGDYQDIEIDQDSVIYCDIPYKDTNAYGKRNRQTFDHERFYEWALRQTVPTVISEYQMPDGFIELASFGHLSSVSATVTKRVTERLFIPEHQRDMFGI